MARSAHVSNKFPWFQRYLCQGSSTVCLSFQGNKSFLHEPVLSISYKIASSGAQGALWSACGDAYADLSLCWTQQRLRSACAPQRLIRVFAVHLKIFCKLGYPQSAHWRLIRLRGCAADLSLLWAHMHSCKKYCARLICYINYLRFQGPVVQSIVSLTSSLVVTVLVSKISNPQGFFLLKNCE